MGEQFTVKVTIDRAERGQGLTFVYGHDVNDYPITWIVDPQSYEMIHAAIGTDWIVYGNDIIAYSGEHGPWGPGGLPKRKETTDGT
jgi:hypothetical protein